MCSENIQFNKLTTLCSNFPPLCLMKSTFLNGKCLPQQLWKYSTYRIIASAYDTNKKYTVTEHQFDVNARIKYLIRDIHKLSRQDFCLFLTPSQASVPNQLMQQLWLTPLPAPSPAYVVYGCTPTQILDHMIYLSLQYII